MRTSLAEGAAAARRALGDGAVEALELPRFPFQDSPYRDFVAAILRSPGLKVDCNGQAPADVLAMVSHRLLGRGAFERERASLADAIAELEDFARGFVAGPPPQISLRTYFAPGDLVWHVDRVAEPAAYRLLWALDRPAGMQVTPADNIDPHLYRAYMRREHPLLCRLDSRVLGTGAAAEALWAHRPEQLQAMISGRFPFLLDPACIWAVGPGAVSIHRVETPQQNGTYHRSSWANRNAPGFQVVITVAGDVC